MRGRDRAVDVTDGDLFGPLLVLALSIVASQALQVSYNLADTYWVGRLGADAVAALSYSWAVVFLMVMMVSGGGGLTVAGTVLISQYKGAKDLGAAHHVAGQTLSFVTLLAAALGVAGYLLSPALMSLIGATPGTAPYEYAVSYTRIVFLGVFQVVLDGFRGSGSTRVAMVFSIQELWVFRIPVAYALLAWTGLGVVGVWYAIAVSYVASALTTGARFLMGTWTDSVVDEPQGVPADD